VVEDRDVTVDIAHRPNVIARASYIHSFRCNKLTNCVTNSASSAAFCAMWDRVMLNIAVQLLLKLVIYILRQFCYCCTNQCVTKCFSLRPVI